MGGNGTLLPRAPRGFSLAGLVAVVAVVLLVALVPQAIKKPLILHMWIMVFLAVAQGAAWNIIGGYAGQYSVGHAAYFGVGAYTTMLLLEQHQIAPWFGLGLSMIIAVLLSGIIGSITFRLRGPYFVLASIAVAEILRLAALHFKDFTRGAEGILLSGIPPLVTPWFTVRFVGKVPFYYASLLLACAVILANWVVRRTKLGYYFQAIREDQDAAHSLGINLTLHKNIALALSAAFTAATGALFALYVRFIDPNIVLGIDVSVQAVLVCIVGGIGTIPGPVLGSIVLVLLSETLRNPKWLAQLGIVGYDSGAVAFIEAHFSNAHLLIYGILVVLVIEYAPDGILGLSRAAWNRWSRSRRPAAPTQPSTV